MFTAVDKALVALIMAVAFLVNTYTPYHLGLDPDTVSTVISGLTPILVYLVPNKGAAA